MKLQGFPNKKNPLIRRLAGLLHKSPVYNGAPDFSYDIGPYRVCRDGSLAVLEENADPVVLDTLVREQLLVDPEPAGSDPTHSLVDSSQRITIQGSTHGESRNDSLQTKRSEPSHGRRQTEPTESSDSAAPPDQGIPNSRPIPQLQPPSAPRPARETLSQSAPPVYNQPIVIRERVVTVQTMINLLNMLYAKGEILNHALLKRNAFRVDESVISDLAYEKPSTFPALQRIMKVQDRAGLVRGIEFTPNTVTFTGFPLTRDHIVREAYETLAASMYRYAASMKWITGMRQNVLNEKFYFRNWLNHLGLTGPENKTYREILLKNLPGNGAFRTNAQLARVRYRRNRNDNNQTETR